MGNLLTIQDDLVRCIHNDTPLQIALFEFELKMRQTKYSTCYATVKVKLNKFGLIKIDF